MSNLLMALLLVVIIDEVLCVFVPLLAACSDGYLRLCTLPRDV